jgi:hypothetical protein
LYGVQVIFIEIPVPYRTGTVYYEPLLRNGSFTGGYGSGQKADAAQALDHIPQCTKLFLMNQKMRTFLNTVS